MRARVGRVAARVGRMRRPIWGVHAPIGRMHTIAGAKHRLILIMRRQTPIPALLRPYMRAPLRRFGLPL